MACGRSGMAAPQVCCPKMIRGSVSAGLQRRCPEAPAMRLQSASLGRNCCRFGLIWIPDPDEIIELENQDCMDRKDQGAGNSGADGGVSQTDLPICTGGWGGSAG